MLHPIISQERFPGLPWPPFVQGRLIRRYKRFLADVELQNGQVTTAHCPNTGSMRGCCTPGRKVYLSTHNNPKRKYKYTWELIEMTDSLVGINTLVPNRLIFESIKHGSIPEISGYDSCRREVTTSPHSRLDLQLTAKGQKSCYIEIKNCTFVEQGVARFPDAVTKRGQKHLTELQKLAAKGARSIIFFLIQRSDAAVFQPADHIDPEYGRMLRQAAQNGVEVLAYDVAIDLKYIRLAAPLPLSL